MKNKKISKVSKKEDKFSEFSQFLNERIRFPKFELIDENGNFLGIVDREFALEKASSLELDLFCINSKKEIPICKITDFSKHIYHLKKGEKIKSKSRKVKSKICKFSFLISDYDIDIKVKRIIGWLDDNMNVNCFLFMRGKEKAYSDNAKKKCIIIIEKIKSYSENFYSKDDLKLSKNGGFFTFNFIKKGDKKNEKN